MTPSVPSGILPDASRDESSRRELQARLAGLGDLRGKKLTPEQKEKKLREACEGFESVFIQKMWQEMRKTVPQGGLLHSREEKFWQDMYDQELAKKMTSAGGIGLADMMYQQLSQNLVSATRSVAGMAQGAAFRPSAAPLLPQNAARRAAAAAARRNDTPQTSSAAATPHANALPSVYEGPAPQHDIVKESGAKAGQKSADDPDILAARADMPAETDPPEVSEALAQLRLQRTTPENGRVEAMPAGQGARRHYPQSGLDLARTAQREAGTKLGPAAVRPPLYPAAKNRQQAVTQADIPGGNPAADNAPQDGLAPQMPREGTQAAGNPGRKVRHTTNAPAGKRHTRGRINDEMLRAMQTQNSAPSPPPLTPPKAEPGRDGSAAATEDGGSRDGRVVPPLTAS
ncbi:MAG: rod-binding protein [Desulfovibrio sp.]|jgi:Rod binding domain-containing protein|nr:rod-binding protein [Desulfovibrio sp.]